MPFAGGMTVMMVTHDVDEAVLLSDRIVMMTNGPAATIGEVLSVDLPRPRNRIALARLEPMLAELSYQQSRLSEMTLKACALDADASQMDLAKAQAADVYRQADGISREIDAFVRDGAQLVSLAARRAAVRDALAAAGFTIGSEMA